MEYSSIQVSVWKSNSLQSSTAIRYYVIPQCEKSCGDEDAELFYLPICLIDRYNATLQPIVRNLQPTTACLNSGLRRLCSAVSIRLCHTSSHIAFALPTSPARNPILGPVFSPCLATLFGSNISAERGLRSIENVHFRLAHDGDLCALVSLRVCRKCAPKSARPKPGA